MEREQALVMKPAGRALLVLAWLWLMPAWSGMVYGAAPTETSESWPGKPVELDEPSWTSLKDAMAKAPQQAKLVAADGAEGDYFGFSVALSGDTALVGAHADDIGANVEQGSAYVFAPRPEQIFGNSFEP